MCTTHLKVSLATIAALCIGGPQAFAQEEGTAGYGKGFTIVDGDNKIAISGRIQGRATYEVGKGCSNE